MNSQHMGEIVTASRNVENLLGYKAEDINGVNINRIMPNSMKE